MSYLVKSKKIEANITKKDITKKSSAGHFYSGDRFYTLLNEYLDKNLSRKSKVLGLAIKFLYKSGNYKHDTSISNGKSWGVLLLDIFGVCCLIGFFAMVIGVVGLSAANIKPSVEGLANFGQVFIKHLGGNVPMIVFAVIFLVCGITWLIMVIKIRKKNKPLSLKDYVTKKVNTCLKLRWLIKLKGNTFDKVITSKKELEVVYLEKFEQQGGAGDRWLNIQLINLLASIFVDFNLVFKFDELTDDEFNELNDIFEYDFKNIELKKI